MALFLSVKALFLCGMLALFMRAADPLLGTALLLGAVALSLLGAVALSLGAVVIIAAVETAPVAVEIVAAASKFAAIAVEFAAVEIVPAAAKIARGGGENADFLRRFAAGALGKGCCFGEVRGFDSRLNLV